MPGMQTIKASGLPAERYWPEGLPRELALPEATLFDNLRATAEASPGKPLVIFNEQGLSYGEALVRIEARAASPTTPSRFIGTDGARPPTSPAAIAVSTH